MEENAPLTLIGGWAILGVAMVKDCMNEGSDACMGVGTTPRKREEQDVPPSGLSPAVIDYIKLQPLNPFTEFKFTLLPRSAK